MGNIGHRCHVTPPDVYTKSELHEPLSNWSIFEEKFYRPTVENMLYQYIELSKRSMSPRLSRLITYALNIV